MQINIKTGILDIARHVSSPNQDERPELCYPELIVIHNISLPPGEFGGEDIDKLFCNKLDVNTHAYYTGIINLKVSSHLLIRRDGEIVQYVAFHRRAWHAGQSAYAGRTACNDFSIGIELEGTDDHVYEEIQYQKLVDVIKCLLHTYPTLSTQRVVGHCDIAPGRKTDPGSSFDWPYLQQKLARISGN